MFILKCRMCSKLDELWIRQPDGSYKVELRCSMTGKEIPDYDADASRCLGFRFSAESRQEYE